MNNIYKDYGISDKLFDYAKDIEIRLAGRYKEIDDISEECFIKVISAFKKHKISSDHLNGSTGYGYDDGGREALENIYADIFHTKAALVRPQIACGTHAIATALSGILRPKDELLSPAGKPYDTLEEVIGIRKSKGSLAEFGISYAQVDLLENGDFDYDNIKKAINNKTKMVTIQRSKGYDFRPTLSVERIGELISFIKAVNPDIICFVDNCYGEFVQNIEPTDVGADLMAGSLIKNPGGGLAPSGGYIVGKKELIELCGIRLTSPGIGSEVGATLGILRSFYQGLFYAPTVVAAAIKGAVLAANLYESLGFFTHPNSTEDRYDIIQAISLKSPRALLEFCRGIQEAAPIDSYVTPTPWAMPGYDSEVIMAAGTFISGASIELSADGPMKPPYNVFYQGGLSYPHAKLGVLLSLQKLVDCGEVRI